ncbi:MAG: hypothetical protein HYX79_02610 [Chloroflexi bacterium]|nr:hypothetical protein [Chloroflexota bacterium]
MYNPEITLGDIIVLVVTIPTLVVGMWKTISYINYRRNPFRLGFQMERTFRGNRPLLSHQMIPIGKEQLYIRMQPKRETLFDRIHVRLVCNKNPKSAFPEREDISITNFGIKAEEISGYISSPATIDKTNGMQRGLSRSYRCAPEDSIYLDLTVTSKIEWSGYIIIEASRADGHRGQGYLGLEVTAHKQ